MASPAATRFIHIPELVLIMLDSLQCPRTRGALRLTNTRLSAIVTPVLFNTVYLSTRVCRAAHELVNARYLQHIRVLCATPNGRPAPVLGALVDVLPQLTNLTSFCAWSSGLKRVHLHILQQSCPNLTSLRISAELLFSSTDPEPRVALPVGPMPRLRGLQTLELRGIVPRPDVRELASLLRDNALTLDSLHISTTSQSNCCRRTHIPLRILIRCARDEFVRFSAILRLTRLAQAYRGLANDDQSLQAPAPLRLRHLSLGHAVLPSTDEKLMHALFDLRSLETIQLDKCHHVGGMDRYGVFRPSNCPNLRAYSLVYMSDRMYWLLKRWDPQWAAQLAMVHKYGPTRPDWTEHGEEAPRDGRILDTVQRCRMRTLNVAYALNSLFPALYPYNSDLARGVLAQAFQTLRDNDDGTLQGLHLVVQMRERQYVPMHLDVLCDCMRGLKGLKHVAIEYDDGAESDEPAQMEIVRDLATAVPTLQFVSIALEPWRIWRTGPYGAAILEPAGVQGTEQGIVRLERLSRVEAMDYELYRLVESLDRWGPNVY